MTWPELVALSEAREASSPGGMSRAEKEHLYQIGAEAVARERGQVNGR